MAVSLHYVGIAITCLAILSSVDAGCVEDTKADADFKECQLSYNTYIADVSQSLGNDGTEILSLLCNEQGRAATSCMDTHIRACTDLKDDPTLNVFAILIQSGGCETIQLPVDAGCVEDTKADADFKECQLSYNTYIADVSQSQGNDGTDILSLLCNDQGRAATSCMEEHMKACTDLKDDPTLNVFAILIQSGGCETIQLPDGPCGAAQKECANVEMFGGDPSMAYAQTEFSKFHEKIKTVCGGVKAQFECLNKHKKDCSELENTFREMMEHGRELADSDTPFPDFDTQRDFVEKKCTSFLKNFTTSKCVKENLMNESFIECYKKNTKQSGRKISCDGYKAAFPCVTTALKGCDEDYIDAMKVTANFFLKATGEGCKIESTETMKQENKTSSAKFYNISFPTILTSLIVLFASLTIF